MAELFRDNIINISRRMGDALYARATDWSEALRIHREWVFNYNHQRHWGHESRQDGCHTPLQVLDWHKGRMYPPAALNRILFATRYTRRLDRHGYVRLHKWRFCGEAGLTRQPVTVWVYDGQLKVEYEATTLAEYQVNLEKKSHRVDQVHGGHKIETPFRSPQLTLFDLEDGWLLYLPARERAPWKPLRRDQATLSSSRCLIFCGPMGSNRYDQRDQRARTFDSLMQVQLESRDEVLRTGLYHDEIYGILLPISQLLFLRRDARDGFIWLCVKKATSSLYFRFPIYECVLKKVDFSGFPAKMVPRGATFGSWFLVAFFTFTLPLRPQATSWFFVAQNQSVHTLPCD